MASLREASYHLDCCGQPRTQMGFSMATWIKRASFVGVIATVGGLVVSACADNEQSLFIRQVQAPESGECSYGAEESSTSFGLGVLDLALTNQYRAGLLIGNQMVPRGDPSQSRAETNRVRLTEAEIHVQLADGAEIGSFTVPGNGFVDPGTGTSPGYGLFMTVLVDPASAQALASRLGCAGSRLPSVGRIVTVVKVFGKTLGGNEVESAEFRYPIEVCCGCLVSFPPEANDPALLDDQPNCMAVSEGTGLEEPCLIGQDTAVDCRICKSRLGAQGAALCEP